MNKINFKLLVLLILITSCQSVKDGLTGAKRENSDEFLIEKKNPLELPPQYGELPVPKKKTIEDSEEISEKIDEDIEKLFENEDSKNTSNISNSTDKSVEDFVLKQIKK